MHFHFILSMALDGGSIIIPILQIRKQRSLKDVKKHISTAYHKPALFFFLIPFLSSITSPLAWKIPLAGNLLSLKQTDPSSYEALMLT